MAVWVDVTDQANWTAQRILFTNASPGCLPTGSDEDTTDIYTWDTDHWVLPTLEVDPDNFFARVPTLRYVGDIDSSLVAGIRVSGTLVGDHTVPVAGAACRHIAIGFDPQPFVDGITPPYFIDDCGVSGADLSVGLYTDGTTFVLETTGDAGNFSQFMQNITAVAVNNDTDFCGPFLLQDDTPASFGLNITKIEFFTESLSLFWQDFVGCEEVA